MKFSTKIRYGIRTMISIGLKHDEEGGVFQKDIAKDQDISVKYLDHIISALKVSHLIKNAAGRKSGYVLTRDPSQITILDIHNAFEPGLIIIDCLEPGNDCRRSAKCASQYFWNQLNTKIVHHFKSITLADMIQTEKRLQSNSRSNSLIEVTTAQ